MAIRKLIILLLFLISVIATPTLADNEFLWLDDWTYSISTTTDAGIWHQGNFLNSTMNFTDRPLNEGMVECWDYNNDDLQWFCWSDNISAFNLCVTATAGEGSDDLGDRCDGGACYIGAQWVPKSFDVGTAVVKNVQGLVYTGCEAWWNGDEWEYDYDTWYQASTPYRMGSRKQYDCNLGEGEYGSPIYYAQLWGANNANTSVWGTYIQGDCPASYVCSEYADDVIGNTSAYALPSPCRLDDNNSCDTDVDCASNDCDGDSHSPNYQYHCYNRGDQISYCQGNYTDAQCTYQYWSGWYDESECGIGVNTIDCGAGSGCDSALDDTESSDVCRKLEGTVCTTSPECMTGINCTGGGELWRYSCDIANYTKYYLQNKSRLSTCNGSNVYWSAWETNNTLNCPGEQICDPYYDQINQSNYTLLSNPCKTHYLVLDIDSSDNDNDTDDNWRVFKINESLKLNISESYSTNISNSLFDIEFSCWGDTSTLYDEIYWDAYNIEYEALVLAKCPGASITNKSWDSEWTIEKNLSLGGYMRVLIGSLYGDTDVGYRTYVIQGYCGDLILDFNESPVDYGGWCGDCENGVLDVPILETEIDYGGKCGYCEASATKDSDWMWNMIKFKKFPFTNAQCEAQEGAIGGGGLFVLFLIFVILLIMGILFIAVFGLVGTIGVFSFVAKKKKKRGSGKENIK